MGVAWSYMLGATRTVVASAIWDGNSYCRYVCPYGNVQRLLIRGSCPAAAGCPYPIGCWSSCAGLSRWR